MGVFEDSNMFLLHVKIARAHDFDKKGFFTRLKARFFHFYAIVCASLTIKGNEESRSCFLKTPVRMLKSTLVSQSLVCNTSTESRFFDYAHYKRSSLAS